MPYAHVQSKIAASGGNITALTVTPDAALTAANGAALTVDYGGANRTIASVKDQSNADIAHTVVAEGYDAGNGAGTKLIVLQNLPSGITAVQVTLSGNAEYGINLGLHEFSGIATSGAVLASGGSFSQQFFSAATDGLTSGAQTVASQPALLFGHAQNCSSGTNFPTAGTGFTALTTTGIPGSRSEHARLTSTGSVAATFTQANNANVHNVMMVALLEANPGITGTGALSSQATAVVGAGLLTPYRRVIRPATILSAQTSAIAGTGAVA